MNKLCTFILIVCGLQLSAEGNAIATGKDSTLVHKCFVELPPWYNTVSVTLPDSINSISDLEEYCFHIKDTQQVIKLWYIGIQKMDLFPAYIGDAWFNAGKYDVAARFYQDILECAANEKGRSAEWECYLYYRIGACFEARKEITTAAEWYRKAIDQRFFSSTGKTKENYEAALCAYRCLMKIRCDQ